MRRVSAAIVALSGLSLFAACDDSQSTGDVTLQVIKRAELAKKLEALQGKIVVLDMWAEF